MDMKVTTERLDNCQIKAIIEVDAAEIDNRLRQTARRISRQFNVPGYRKGKAPFHAVLRIFGREAVQQEGLDDWGNELYEAALEQIDVDLYQQGELQEVEWEPFRMTVLLPLQPEVELGDYRVVRVPVEPEPVTDEMIEARLAEYQHQHTQWVPVERPAEFDDQVVVDFEGKVGERLIMSNEEHEMVLQDGATAPMPGFAEAVVGMSPGEDKTFILTVPEDDEQEDLQGQEATVTAHLHTVREQDVPPLDDELAMMVGTYDTLDDLRAALREEMEAAALQQAESGYLDKVLEAMIEQAPKVDYPPQAIDREAEILMDRMEQSLAGTGMDLDRFLAMIGKTREVYKQEVHPAAEDRLRKRLVLREIIELEHLTAEEDEVAQEIERLVEDAGPEADRMREVLDNEMGRLMVTDDLLMNKVQERVIQIGKGEAPELEVEAEVEAEAEPEAKVEVEAAAAAAAAAEVEVEVEAEAEEDVAGEDSG